ncbi:tape measure protein [Methylococcus sp. EFPC2]|uniref:tape measure protein n=1 Tax=Methylococcus sp. EFPC2 TaxID=2812648 RepID=UPI0019675D35|nr:tape measure protein [Methylococcus sp. EFPC2]QSA98732.1 hypothetical protein JWZ97_08095 [Methylococcus sp. EFPC2]
MASILSSLSIDLSANIARLQADMNRANATTAQGFARMESVARSTSSAIKGLIGGAFAGITLGKSFEILKEFDTLNASLKTVTGSLDAAGQASTMLRQFATETPYELKDVTEAFIRLRSLGLDASVESLRSFGNTASAMGKPLMQFIEAVADASTGEFERLKEFGVKAKQNGDQVALTFQGQTTTIKNSAQEIQRYLLDLGNTKFASGMKDQMETLSGASSNLSDSFSNLVDTIGNLGVRDAIKASFGGAVELLNELNREIHAFNSDDLTARITRYEDSFYALNEQLKASKQATKSLGDQLKYAFTEGGGFGVSDQDVQQLQGRVDTAKDMLHKLYAERAALEKNAPDTGGTPQTRPAPSAAPNKSQQNDALQQFRANLSGMQDAYRQQQELLRAFYDYDQAAAGENAQKKLEAERRYLEDSAALQERNIQQNIDAKQQELAAIKDRGDQAKIIGEITALESELSNQRAISALKLQTLSEEETRSAKQRRDEIYSVFEAVKMKADEDLVNGISGTDDKLKGATDSAREFGLVLSSAAGQAITNWQGFGNLLQSLGQDISQLILKTTVLQPLEDSLSNINWGSIGSSLLSSFFFADGGIMTSRGPLPLHAYASGGIANSAQLAVFGEGRQPEAFVPLPDGRSIPVTVSGTGSESAVPNITQIFNIQGGGDAGLERRLAQAAEDGAKRGYAMVQSDFQRNGPIRRTLR